MKPLVLGLAAAAGLVVLYRFDPSTTPIYPLCSFHLVTGLWCPGCGSTRALYALLHGEVARALRLNALLVAAVGIGPAAWLLARALPTLRQALLRPAVLWALAGLAVAFGVLRNLPGWEALAPP